MCPASRTRVSSYLLKVSVLRVTERGFAPIMEERLFFLKAVVRVEHKGRRLLKPDLRLYDDEGYLARTKYAVFEGQVDYRMPPRE